MDLNEKSEQDLLWDTLDECFPTNIKLSIDMKKELEHTEKEYVETAYKENNFNQSKAAKALGLGRTLLIHKLKKYDLLEGSV